MTAGRAPSNPNTLPLSKVAAAGRPAGAAASLQGPR